MANKLVMSGSYSAAIEAIEDNADGNSYESYQADKVVGQGGGSVSMTYTDARAMKVTGIISVDSAAQMANGACFVGNGDITGTAPSSTGVKALYVKYIKRVGDPGYVKVRYGAFAHAELAPGEAVAIPYISATLTSFTLHTENAYVEGGTEAYVEAVLIGD
jgi:hypothetical protein